jgi:nickel/cobalt transporter (NicO) family protein
MKTIIRFALVLLFLISTSLYLGALQSPFDVVGAGFLSGGLHAVSGPDHLASILPCILGQRWNVGLQVGAVWGFGHGITSLLIGIVGYTLRDSLMEYDISYLVPIKNFAIGLTFLAIGSMGIKEVTDELKDQSKPPTEEPTSTHIIEQNVFLAYLLNGCLLGLTWDGLPSLAPTIALPHFDSVIVFLVCYCIGTSVFMAIVSSVVAHASTIVGEVVGQNFPSALALIASVVSIVIGVYWFLYSIVLVTIGDALLVPYLNAFTALAVVGSAASSAVIIATYARNSPVFAAFLAPLVYYLMISLQSSSSILASPDKKPVVYIV